MQKKVKKINWLACLTILVLCVAFCLPATAQKQRKDFPFALKEGTSMSSITADYYEKEAQLYKTDRTQERRNRLIFMAVSQIDLNFRSYERKRRHNNNLFQTVINILEVGAATAISITNGERAKSLIADALGFIQGSRDSINKNYRLLERQVLINKMIEKRSKILTVIYQKADLPDTQYPFERAFIDLLDYFEAGTVDSALNSLATDTGSSASNAQQLLVEAKRKAGIVLAPTANQIKVSRENSDFVQAIIDSENSARAKIAEADEKIKLADKTISDENAKSPPDASVIANANKSKQTAETDKTAAQAAQKAAMDKLAAIFTSVEQDSELSPLLDQLPEKYPNLASRINASLGRIREDKGTPDDYASIVLKVYRKVTDLVLDNPTAVERAKNILESVK
jgi:hypothetical protein